MPPIRKYQVFVSATFVDLEEERQHVFHAVMTARQIPVGMEHFTAADDRGWKVIQRVIDTSDYYVVVVAGRYGSIDPSHGMSWTEREYRYARDKGIKVLAFIRKDSRITADMMDTEPDKAAKQARLADFKAALRSSHLCPEWESGEDLARRVSDALRNQIQDDEADGVAPPGWVRGGDSLATASELAKLSEENRTLREKLASLGVEKSVVLLVEAVGATDEGSITVSEPFLVLEDEERLAGIWDMRVAQMGSSREDMQEFMEKKNRAAVVRLLLLNEGTAPASEVEVRIDVSRVDDTDLDLPRPTSYAIAPYTPPAMDRRRNGSRNVTVEGEHYYEDHTACVIQRVKSLAPKADVELVPFYIFVREEGGELAAEVKVTAIDLSGARVAKTFTYRIVHEGREIVTEKSFH
jgi:hypothetical protein